MEYYKLANISPMSAVWEERKYHTLKPEYLEWFWLHYVNSCNLTKYSDNLDEIRKKSQETYELFIGMTSLFNEP